MKPYRVDFTFQATDKASMYVVAPDKDAAAEGALKMLEQYENPKVISVEEVKAPDPDNKPTIQ